MPADNGAPAPALVAARELSQQTQLLHALVADVRAELVEVGVSDAYGRELMLEHFPVTGVKRVLAHRTGNGFDGLSVSAAPGVLVLAANEARIGCQLVNTGTNPALVYLADQPRKGAACVWIAANGGAWDGRFGNVPWAGNVWAVGQGGATTFVGGEI